MTIRAAIYLRVSLDATGEKLAIQRQEEDARRLAKDRGWTVYDVFADNSISASKRNVKRPAYDRMVADYEAGRFGAIICYDLDRLTRQPRQLEDWIDAASDKGLKLVTLNGEADLSTDGGQMFARVKAAMARSEIDRKGERQRRALLQRAQMGKAPLGVRLTGYQKDGTVDQAEAATVRRIFSAFHAGDSLKGITYALNRDSVPARGERWTPSTVRTILTNARYAGRVVYRGEVLTGVQGNWEPLVDGDVFDAIQVVLDDDNRKKNRQGTARRHLGSGLYECNVCGRRLQSNGGRYWCRTGGCLIRTMAPIDDKVRAFMQELLSSPSVAALAAPDRTEEARELDDQAKRLRARQTVLDADYDDGNITGVRHKVASEKVQRELDDVNRQRAALSGDRAAASILGDSSPAAAFAAASLDVQRAVIDSLAIVRLLPVKQGRRGFDPDSVRIVFRHYVIEDDGVASPDLSPASVDALRQLSA